MWASIALGGLGGAVGGAFSAGTRSSGLLFKETAFYMDPGVARNANSTASSAAAAFFQDAAASISGSAIGNGPGSE